MGVTRKSMGPVLVAARRAAVVAIPAFAISPFIKATNGDLISGVLVEAVSILGGVAIAGAFYFTQHLPESRQRTLENLSTLRSKVGMPPHTREEELDIYASFDESARSVHMNTVAILLTLAAFALAATWLVVDLPMIKWPENCHLSKMQAAHGLALSCFALLIRTTYDIISTAFALAQLNTMPKA